MLFVGMKDSKHSFRKRSKCAPPWTHTHYVPVSCKRNLRVSPRVHLLSPGVLQAKSQAKVTKVSSEASKVEGRVFRWNKRPKATLLKAVSMRAMTHTHSLSSGVLQARLDGGNPEGKRREASEDEAEVFVSMKGLKDPFKDSLCPSQ